MIDHVSLGVSDMERSKAFYDAALAPLGIRRFYDLEFGSGYGPTADQALFWIGYPYDRSRKATAGIGSHVAFAASDRAAVDAFHAAALAAGGRDDGRPGIRTEYSPNYYGAFILDPDGHKIEAVCHKPE